MKKFSLLCLLFCLSASTLNFAQTKTTQSETFQVTYDATKALVASKNYQFIANLIYDDNKRAQLDEALNKVSVSSAKISGVLETFQKADRTHSFKGNMTSYGHFFDDEKQEILIKITNEGYKLDIEIKPNGKAFLTLSGTGSSELMYIGKLQK